MTDPQASQPDTHVPSDAPGEPGAAAPSTFSASEFDAELDAAVAADEQAVAAAEEAVVHDVEALLSERDELLATAQRIQADFENYRRRTTQQLADEIDRATGRLAEALLPVLDAAERAYVAHPAEVEPLFNLLLGELRKQGLEVLDLHEQPFDPSVAEAVMHEPGDAEVPVVAEVLRSGYLWKGKVLRPAMVKVRG